MYVQYGACITAEQRVHKRSILVYIGVIYSDSSNGSYLGQISLNQSDFWLAGLCQI